MCNSSPRPDEPNVVPIFGVPYRLIEVIGPIRGADGVNTMCWADAVTRELLISRAVPADRRDQVLMILVAQACEMQAELNAKQGMVAPGPQRRWDSAGRG